jgi:hypothetical protein
MARIVVVLLMPATWMPLVDLRHGRDLNPGTDKECRLRLTIDGSEVEPLPARCIRRNKRDIPFA